jgi:hypothetical protein
VPTALLRDDFTGSGTLIGRTPDGVNGGAWVDAPNVYGSIPATGVIGSGVLSESGASASHYVGATAPLTGSPADAYIEARFVANLADPGRGTLGIRWIEGTPSGYATGLQLDLTTLDATHARVQVVRNPSGIGMQPGGGYVNYVVANGANYVARLEVQGTAVRLYLDGTLVWSGTQTEANAGGAAYVSLGPGTSAQVSFDYVEAGSLSAPVIPAFWTALAGSREVI